MKTAWLLLLNLTFLLTICSGQIKPIGEEVLILDKFDFKTPISALYPDKYKSKKFENYYEIPSKLAINDYNGIEKETIFDYDYEQERRKAVGIEYRQQSSRVGEKLAVFGKQTFDKINLATTLNNKIKIISATAQEISQTESKDFIKYLTARYGAAKKLKGEFADKTFYIYQWKTKDRTFRYVPVINDESNTLKIEVNQTEKTIKPGKKEPHLEGYFYIIKNEFIKNIINTRTGDFAFLNEKKP